MPHPTRRPLLRLATRALGALLLLLVVAVATVYGLSERRLRARFDVPEHPLADAAAGAPSIADGRHQAIVHGCSGCHGENLGGRVLVDAAPVGRFVTANLTAGGSGARLADRDWERAVRHGVRRDGTALLLMPAHELAGMPDRDLANIIAYARSLPPVTDPLPPSTIGPLARALLLAGKLALVPAERVEHERGHLASLAPARTAAYGAHIGAGCAGCHGAAHRGGPIPGAPPDWPPAADISAAALASWSEADFVRALREGRRRDGTAIRPPMPLESTREMTDVELGALWLYLRSHGTPLATR